MTLGVNLFGYIMIFFIIYVCLKIYQESDAFNLKCIVSDVDGNKYCVRETAKLELVADLLARVTGKMSRVVKHLAEKYPDRDNVKRLKDGFNPKKIVEYGLYNRSLIESKYNTDIELKYVEELYSALKIPKR